MGAKDGAGKLTGDNELEAKMIEYELGSERHLYIESNCREMECMLRFTRYSSFYGDPPTMYLHYFLPRDRFWKRLWLAVRYLFNRFPPYGYFGETSFEEDSAYELCQFLYGYLSACYRHRTGGGVGANRAEKID